MAKFTHNGQTIITSHVYPPIPCRNFDWSAHVDELGADCSPCGHGATEADAIANLIEQLEDEED